MATSVSRYGEIGEDGGIDEDHSYNSPNHILPVAMPLRKGSTKRNRGTLVDATEDNKIWLGLTVRRTILRH